MKIDEHVKQNIRKDQSADSIASVVLTIKVIREKFSRF